MPDSVNQKVESAANAAQQDGLFSFFYFYYFFYFWFTDRVWLYAW